MCSSSIANPFIKYTYLPIRCSSMYPYESPRRVNSCPSFYPLPHELGDFNTDERITVRFKFSYKLSLDVKFTTWNITSRLRKLDTTIENIQSFHGKYFRYIGDLPINHDELTSFLYVQAPDKASQLCDRRPYPPLVSTWVGMPSSKMLQYHYELETFSDWDDAVTVLLNKIDRVLDTIVTLLKKRHVIFRSPSLSLSGRRSSRPPFYFRSTLR